MINLDFDALRLIGLTPAIASQLHLLAAEFADTSALQAARITEVHRHRLTLHNGHSTLNIASPMHQQGSVASSLQPLAVGDWCLVDKVTETHFTWVSHVEPSNHLCRLNSEGHRQALAANIDTALLVMGLDYDFNLRRLERYLTLTSASQIFPVIVLTKADLHPESLQRVREVEQRVLGGIPIYALDTRCENTKTNLAPWLGAGQTLVLLGSSGAGKSSLTNTLCGSTQATGGVRLKDSRGHHTTSSRSLHLCSSGACIIDTPGLRGLKLDIDEVTLNTSFSDIDKLAKECQFRDCQHNSEPGCAVRDRIDEDRFKNYQKLLRETRRHQQTPLDKIASKSKWKVLMKMVKEKDKMKWKQ